LTPSLPLDPTVTVQLVKTHAVTDACWDADYASVIFRNDTGLFKANGE
jgi:hypothetical protein